MGNGPSLEDREDYVQALLSNNQNIICPFLRRHDIHKLSLFKSDDASKKLPLHTALQRNKLSAENLDLVLNAIAQKKKIAKEVLESTCHRDQDVLSNENYVMILLDNDAPISVLHVFFEHALRHNVLKKLLQHKDACNDTCLHYAVRCIRNEDISTLNFLIGHYPTMEMFQNVFAARNKQGKFPTDYTSLDTPAGYLLRDPECWQKCRYWLFSNFRQHFLNSVNGTSTLQTIEALRSLKREDRDPNVAAAIAHLEGREPVPTTTTQVTTTHHFSPPTSRVSTEEHPCILCLDRERDHCCVPCGHVVYCGVCVVGQTSTRCPVCRTTYRNIIKIYR